MLMRDHYYSDMKKIYATTLLLGLVILTSSNLKAQEVGIRAGELVGGNIALDLLLETQKYGLLHVDISMSDHGTDGTFIGAEALSDFLYQQLGREAINLYLGVGPSALFADTFWLGVSFEAGLDYHFSGLPISIGGDWRPTLWLVGPVSGTEFEPIGFGFNLRFVFQ